jgi:DNA-binding NarL/FixJ family response regulator
MNDLGPRIRVFLLVGNRILREALGRILQKRLDLFVAGQSTEFSNMAALIAQSEADVILMDSATTPPLNLELVHRACHLCPTVRVLMIGMDADEATFLSAVRAGVSGYLLDEASAMEVVAAIRAVSQGEAVCPPQLCLALFKTVARAGSSVPSVRRLGHGLTRRQQELIPMIAQGLTNKEIASHLNLSEQTIKNHIHRMLRKVGANDRLEVVERMGVQDFAISTPRFASRTPMRSPGGLEPQ